jgi:hypothetical protein
MSGSIFGDFAWLSAFSTDAYRLAAIVVAAIALVAISAVRPIAQARVADRADARFHQRRWESLVARIADERESRKLGRLDLDA